MNLNNLVTNAVDSECTQLLLMYDLEASVIASCISSHLLSMNGLPLPWLPVLNFQAVVVVQFQGDRGITNTNPNPGASPSSEVQIMNFATAILNFQSQERVNVTRFHLDSLAACNLRPIMVKGGLSCCPFVIPLLGFPFLL